VQFGFGGACNGCPKLEFELPIILYIFFLKI
jgi:hypothetical protein